jgi:hypothetical protein
VAGVSAAMDSPFRYRFGPEDHRASLSARPLTALSTMLLVIIARTMEATS